MSLTEREREMVAIGAAIGGNCIPCLQWHYEKCKEIGLGNDEMREAFGIARKVKEVPNNKIYETMEKLNQ